MAKTLLNGVNEVLIKAQIVSNTSPLTSLTDSGKQVFIDQAIQVWNEAVDMLYSKFKDLKPLSAAESTITLATGTRTYTLASDLILLEWPFHNETDGDYILKYPGEYDELRRSQSQPSNHTGEPWYAALSPLANEIYVNREPTSDENGDVYKYLYWKDTVLSSASDTFPFQDAAFRAFLPYVHEQFREVQNQVRDQNKSELIKKRSMGAAMRMVRKERPKETYPQRKAFREHWLDPFNAR